MLLRRYRFIAVAGSAVLALSALFPSDTLAQQLSLGNVRSLDFGRFVAGSGGTVVLAPGGLRSRTGAVVLLSSPNAGQAIFNANRANGNQTAVSIGLPANGSIRLVSGGNSMTVTNFVSTPASTGSLLAPMTLSIGATLTVAPNQAPGNYSGTFSVTVDYQ
jgi:hypothetical protein